MMMLVMKAINPQGLKVAETSPVWIQLFEGEELKGRKDVKDGDDDGDDGTDDRNKNHRGTNDKNIIIAGLNSY